MTEKPKSTRARRTTKKKASSRSTAPSTTDSAESPVANAKASEEKQATLSEATINLKELKLVVFRT